MKQWVFILLIGAVMTTYNTGNAVGSTDARDLSDNAKNFDLLSAGAEMEYPDRLGVPRKSWAGMEQQVADFMAAQGWEALTIPYAANAVVQRPTQLVERAGELYRVRLQSDLPLTLSGTWATDALNLVAVGNQPLRDDLAAPGGAGMIGYGGEEDYAPGTAGDAIQQMSADIAELSQVAPGSALSLSDVMSKTVTGGALVINAFGDSMTYGQDTTSTTGDLLPGINGSSATRALYQYPEALGAALTKAGFNVTVNNYGFPGDTAVQGLTRFPSAVASDISIIMFGHNDAVDVSGSPRTSPADFKSALSDIIKREFAKGSFPVLLTPPRIKQSNFTGANLNRQLWMRVFESTIVQLGQQFAIPVVSADELVGHRGGEIYSDDVHFNKYGYNELGWNLSALFIQRSSEPKRISNGTVIQAAGSSVTGGQSLIGANTVLRAQPTAPLCISGYFDDGLVARVHIVYNTGVGGSQRGKITLGGGLRNGPTPQTKVAVASAAPGRILNSDVIPAGYRTLFFETAGSTTNVYVEKIEFVRSDELLNDSAGVYGKASALEGVKLALNTGEATRFIVDDSNPLIGDFTLEADLSADPGAADSAGIALVSEYDEATGLPSKYILVTRRGDASDFVFVRLATSSNVDTTYTTVAFSSADTAFKIVRSGDSFSVYAQGALLTTLTHAFGRLNPALYRERAAVTASRVTIKR